MSGDSSNVILSPYKQRKMLIVSNLIIYSIQMMYMVPNAVWKLGKQAHVLPQNVMTAQLLMCK